MSKNLSKQFFHDILLYKWRCIMIERKKYLQKLIDFKDTNLIKVVTGIRRCGKSTLFELYQEYLRNFGILEEQIIAINFEDLQYEELQDYKELYKYINERLKSNHMNYVFLDEIQVVDDFQKTVDSLYIKKNVDIYITGSNAKLLSGELATLLSGRYVEIFMLPLSFAEYSLAIGDIQDTQTRYNTYLKNSSFPGTLELKTYDKIKEYLAGIYNTIILKDIIERKKIQDVFMLESVIKFMFDNVGNLFSTRKIANTMKSEGRKISPNTVEIYLASLVDSYILYRVGRYDVKGKQYLKTGEKYYLADIGLRRYLLGNRAIDQGRVLENVVYLELVRRGYEVHIGKQNEYEIDFVATKEETIEYYQVALTIRDENTLNRELRALKAINDHYPKIILSMDNDLEMSYDGIRCIYAIDWLLMET